MNKLHCLTTTREDGSKIKIFYRFETAMDWDYRDGKGQVKPNVVYSYEEYDGKSILITSNGD